MVAELTRRGTRHVEVEELLPRVRYRYEFGRHRALDLVDPDTRIQLGITGEADPGVADWASGVPSGQRFVSSITFHELEHGVVLAERAGPPKGDGLHRWLDVSVVAAFDQRVLGVDAAVARRAAVLVPCFGQLETDHGSITSRSRPVKSVVLRVASVVPRAVQIAAIMPSSTASGRPAARRSSCNRA